MSKYRFDMESLRLNLAKQSPAHNVAFAASCSERLLPNYHAFSAIEKWGQYELLRVALDEVWTSLEGGTFDTGAIRELIEKCESAVPNTEDFDSILTSAALDAANAVLETLECALDGNPARAAEVGCFARDTVDMYIQQRDALNPSDPRFEEKISLDPLMIRELRKQWEDLDLLRASELNAALVQKLRSSFDNRGRSNIDIG